MRNLTARSWPPLVLIAMLLAAPAGAAGAVRLRQPDGGAAYYQRFPRSLPADPDYFPVGVWFESVTSQADVRTDRAAGINLYVALTANSSLPLLAANGVRAIPQQEEWVGRASAPGSGALAGWLLGDEIDMQKPPAEGRATLQSILAGLPAGDGRVRYANFGKGVTFWESDADAAAYVNGFTDVASADNYWFTDPNICGRSEGGALLAHGAPLSAARCRLAANYGRTVDRMRALTRPAGSRPVWGFVEVGHPATEPGPSITPAQVRAAVWSSLIHGARGIVYFNHSFGGPHQTQHALREPAYAAVRRAVARTNARIRRLAPVLNAPFADGLVRTRAAVDTMAKYSGGKFYVFAGSRSRAAQRARFRVPCTGNARVSVVDEHRTLALRNGAFTDRFADANAVHVYRIDGGSTCGLPVGSAALVGAAVSAGRR